MDEENKNIEQAPQKQQSKKKLNVALIIIIAVIAIAIVVMISMREQEVSKMKMSDLYGNWISTTQSAKKGYRIILIIHDDDNFTYDEYLIHNGKLDTHDKGTYDIDEDKQKIELSSDDIDAGDTNYSIDDWDGSKLSVSYKYKKDDYSIEYVKIKKGSKADKMYKSARAEVSAQEKAQKEKEEADAAAEEEKNRPKEHVFGAGKYTCGKDFEAGTYDLIALSGDGNVFCDDEGLNEILGTDGDYSAPSYKGETFMDGDILEIQDNLQLKLTPKK